MKTIFITLGIITTVILGSWLMLFHPTTASPADISPSPSVQAAAPPSPTPLGTVYTMRQIATHNGQTSCWTAINGVVYDLTPFLAAHPGGERTILAICGIDGSDAFNAQHGGQGRPEQLLATLRIGMVAR